MLRQMQGIVTTTTGASELNTIMIIDIGFAMLA